jgi:UDP-glucose 4-epimerase
VTGVTGFLGSRLVHRLLSCGWSVVGLLRPGGSRPVFAHSPRLAFVEADLSGGVVGHQARAALRDVSTVYHLAGAGLHEARPLSPGAIARTNVIGTLAVLDLVEAIGAVRLVHCGSGLEYGPGQHLNEDAPLRPVGSYAATKAAASLVVQAAASAAAVVILRPFTIYGPGDSAHSLVSQSIASALRGEDILVTPGEQTRDFIYVDDVVEALRLAGTAEAPSGVFNVATGTETSVRTLVEMIVEVCGSGRPRFGALPYRSGDPSRSFGDPGLAVRELGWSPQTSLRVGLERTVAWLADAWESSPRGATGAAP